MGRIKELQEKADRSKAEEKELQELLSEAKESDTEVEKSEESEEKAIDEAAKKLADKAVEDAESRLSKSIDALTEKLNKGIEVPTSDDVSVKSPKFIVDKKYGKKSVDELADIKETIKEREQKGKTSTEISRKSMNFVQAMLAGDKQKLQILVEGTGSRGGFLVPDDYADMIIEDIRDASTMRGIADVMTTSSDTLHLPNLAARPQASFRAEAATKQTTTVDFGENVFTPYSIASIVGLSNELVADAQLGVGSSIVNKVAEYMGTAIAEREDRAFWTGSGTNEPTGVDQYTIGTIASGVTDSNRADTLIQTYWRLPQGYRNRAVWVANAVTLERLRALKDSQNNYLMGAITGTAQPTILGRPVVEANWVAGGTVYFGDFSYYVIVDRAGLEVAVSDEAVVASTSAFESNLTYVRVEKRVDGELTLTNPLRSATNMGTP